MKKTAIKILGLAIIIVLVFVYIKHNMAIADFEGELLSKKEFFLDIDGNSQKFSINIYKNNSDFHSYIVRDNFFDQKSLELSGFEEDIKTCEKNPVDLGNDQQVICLTGFVGAHSQNVQLINFEDNRFSAIEFISPESKTKNIISDVPNVLFKDYNSDNVTDLIVDNRDYDLDPTSSAIRDYYLGTNQGFVFDRQNNITYN